MKYISSFPNRKNQDIQTSNEICVDHTVRIIGWGIEDVVDYWQIHGLLEPMRLVFSKSDELLIKLS